MLQKLTANRYIPNDKDEAFSQLWQIAENHRTVLNSLVELCDATVTTKQIIDMVKPLAREAITYKLPLVYDDEAYTLGYRGGGVDHGALSGLADDDHTQYLLVNGTRAFTGDQAMGTHKITGLAAPTTAGDAIRQTASITEAALESTIGASHARAHGLLTVANHSDVATYLNQALLTTSTPQFARLGIGAAAHASTSLIVNATDSNRIVMQSIGTGLYASLTLSEDAALTNSASITRYGSAYATAILQNVLDITTASNNGNILLRPHGTGKVGICGANTPLAPLDVYQGTVSAGLPSICASNAYGHQISIGYDGIWRRDTDSDTVSLAINRQGYEDGTTRFRDVDIMDGKGTSIAYFDGSTRRVGIGTASPVTGTLLHVAGASVGAIQIENTADDDTDFAALKLYNSYDSSVAYGGKVEFFAKNNNATPEKIRYGFIRSDIISVVDGDEDGNMVFQVIGDGSDGASGKMTLTKGGLLIGAMMQAKNITGSDVQTVAVGIEPSGELVINGTFAADTNWTKDGGATISGGVANLDGTGQAVYPAVEPAIVAGASYSVTFTVGANPVRLSITCVDSGHTTSQNLSDVTYAAGTHTVTFEAVLDQVILYFNGRATGAATLDDVSMQSVDVEVTPTSFVIELTNADHFANPYVKIVAGSLQTHSIISVSSITATYCNTRIGSTGLDIIHDAAGRESTMFIKTTIGWIPQHSIKHT